MSNDDVGICFIVFQVDVEHRLVFLDQGIFQQEGILLTVNDRKFNAAYPPDEFGRFEISDLFGKITADPFAQVAGLAHIDQFPAWL